MVPKVQLKPNCLDISNVGPVNTLSLAYCLTSPVSGQTYRPSMLNVIPYGPKIQPHYR